MASLQNEQIDQSYQGLIKTANNTSAAPFPPVKLQYGDGTELPIKIGDGTGVGIGDIVTLESGTRAIDLNSTSLALTGVTFVNALAGTCNISNGTYEFGLPFPGAPATNVDFSNATVTGLPGGAAGLESGTGSNSMQSAASLTTTAANASGGESIALGNNARAAGGVGIAIGNNAHAQNNEALAIGPDSFASGNAGTLAIGRQSNSTAIDSAAVGRSSNATGSQSAAFGRSADAQGEQATAVGYDATATANLSTAIGERSVANAQGAVAIGTQVTASTVNTATVNLLQIAGYASMNYADDTAAAAGGIPLGGVYHTSGALKIRIA